MTIAPTLTPTSAPPGATLVNILTPQVKVKVSSGSSKDAKSILDGSAETCWTSDNLPPNSDPASSLHLITFRLSDVLSLGKLHSVSLTLAGGFSPMSLSILSSQDGKDFHSVVDGLFPMDTNAKQFFQIDSAELGDRQAAWLRFQLNGSTDDYGRVIVYQAEIFATS